MQFTDQLNQRIEIPQWPPRRIISLVPSQTELLFDLQLDAEVVGITKFCVHPNHWFLSKKRIGGTKTVDMAKVHALRPDLVIGNKEENVQEQIEELKRHYPVWMSDVSNLDQAFDMIKSIGNITGKNNKAEEICTEIKQSFEKIASITSPLKRRAAYFIWRKPWMVAGGDTFIHDMMQRCGWENVFANQSRYPQISNADIVAADPEWILLSSEPYPFSEKHIALLQEICPNAQICLVDGELFSWYGSRLKYVHLMF